MRVSMRGIMPITVPITNGAAFAPQLTIKRFENANGACGGIRSNAINADRVEITLVTDAATYEKFAPQLDALIGQFDLVTHVRRGGS